MGTADSIILSDLFDLIILNEILRKKLLTYVREYVLSFGKAFDFSKPISCIDFYNFIKKNNLRLLILNQFLLNLELFIIKYYKLGEINKEGIKRTKLKLLRQSFAHRTSGDILGGQERVVACMGFIFNFYTLFFANMSEGAKQTQTIKYQYNGYILTLLILSDSLGNLEGKRKNVRQLKKLNQEFIKKLFPKS